jgi:hypothetical protein
MSDDFKAAVEAYINLHDEIARSSKQMRELKKQKDKVGEVILQWMKTQDVDACELSDGKLVRKVSKRTEGLKKEHVLSELVKLLHGDEAAATMSLNNIFSNRSIAEKEILTRTTNKSV